MKRSKGLNWKSENKQQNSLEPRKIIFLTKAGQENNESGKIEKGIESRPIIRNPPITIPSPSTGDSQGAGSQQTSNPSPQPNTPKEK